jgi:hypothetical protein
MSDTQRPDGTEPTPLSGKERLGMIALYYLVMDDDELQRQVARARRSLRRHARSDTPSWASH